MAIKTFNIEQDTYSKFSTFCKEHGMSMSKQVEMFMKSIVDNDPEAKREYLEKLQRIRGARFVHVADFGERYGL